MRRKRRRRFQVTCWCSRYEFPHRLGGGRCHGEDWTQYVYYFASEFCAACNCNAGGTCEVSTGQESVKECDARERYIEGEIYSRYPGEFT